MYKMIDRDLYLETAGVYHIQISSNLRLKSLKFRTYQDVSHKRFI